MKGVAVITAGYSSAAPCRQPGGLEVQTQAVSQLAALPHQSRDKEGQGTQQSLACPSSTSLFLVAPLLMSDVHTFLSSYLIIFIIKMIFMSAASREGKKRMVTVKAQGEEGLYHHSFSAKALATYPKRRLQSPCIFTDTLDRAGWPNDK